MKLTLSWIIIIVYCLFGTWKIIELTLKGLRKIIPNKLTPFNKNKKEVNKDD